MITGHVVTRGSLFFLLSICCLLFVHQAFAQVTPPPVWKQANSGNALTAPVYGYGLYGKGDMYVDDTYVYTVKVRAWFCIEPVNCVYMEKRLKSNGALVWAKPVTNLPRNGVYWSYWPKGLTIGPEGFYISFTTHIQNADTRVILARFDLDGNFAWKRESSLFPIGSCPQCEAWHDLELYGGHVYAAGKANHFAAVRKYDAATGATIWTQQYNGAYLESFSTISVDASGVYVGGVANHNYAAWPNITADGITRKYDHNGNELWTHLTSNHTVNVVDEVQVAPDGVYTIVTAGDGSTWAMIGNELAYLQKHNKNTGAILWTKSAPQPERIGGFGLQVALAGNDPHLTISRNGTEYRHHDAATGNVVHAVTLLSGADVLSTEMFFNDGDLYTTSMVRPCGLICGLTEGSVERWSGAVVPSLVLEVCDGTTRIGAGGETVPVTRNDSAVDTYTVYYDDTPDCAGTNIAGTVNVSEVPNPDANALTATQAVDLTVNTTNPDPGDRYENVVITHDGQVVTLAYTVIGGIVLPPTLTLIPDANPITEGDDVTLTWNTTNVTSCSAPWTSSTAANDSETLTNVTTTQTYTITCTGTDGSTPTADTTVTVTPLPNLTADVGAITPSAGFDPATGYYDHISITYNVRNPAAGDAGASDLRFQVDLGNDGSFDNTFTVPISALPGGGGETGTTLQLLVTNVPPGTHRVVMEVDYDNRVIENDETDNVFIRTGPTFTYPDPSIDLTVSPTLVRSGEPTTVSWNTNVTYDLDCRLLGPGITPTHTFNPLTDGAIGSLSNVGPITAKSEYLLECTAPDGTTFTDTATVETTGTIEEV